MRIFRRMALVTLCLVSNALFSQSQDNTPVEYSITITNPEDQETFQSAQDTIPVSVEIDPELQPGDELELYVDGKAEQKTSSPDTLETPRLYRGSHTLQVKVIQPNGNGAESPMITIFQHRVSILLSPAYKSKDHHPPEKK